MMKKPHRFFTSIRSRILISTISIILLISAIITFISYFIVSYNLRQSLIQTSETKLSFLCSSIDSNVNDIKSFIHTCQVSKKIEDFCLEEESSNNRIKREASDFVRETYSANSALPSHLIRLVIIGKNRSDIVQVVESSYSSISVSAAAITSLPYFEELRSHQEELSTNILPDPFFSTKKVSMIPFVYSVYHPYNADEIGYIFAEMSTKVITEPIETYSSETDNRILFQIGDESYEFQDNKLVFSETSFKLIQDFSYYSLNQDTTIKHVKESEGNISYYAITKPLGIEGWYITEYVNDKALTNSISQSFFLIVLIIIAVASMIGLIIFHFLSLTVTVPVAKLQTRMKRIEQGDFSRDLSTEWNHELGDIGKTINDLSENVLQLMNQRIEDEKEKKDYEYRMLQSQINPHFLYNTLNSIKWMATIQNAPGIAEMTTSLSRLLKDISKGTSNLVSLKHELSLLQDYFTIQQYRYGGTITLDISIENEELTSCEILKFTLQPLVENAIFHGIEPKGTAGKITIHIYQDDSEDIHIDVTDDGVGIEPELVKRLLTENTSASSSFFKEIGVSNVHKRLQYEFGEKYGLSIISTPREYTTVSILLPFRKSEENYV